MTNRTIAWISGILTLLLVVFSFILSYQNLVALATEKGIPVPGLFPWVVEFAVVVFSVGVLRRSLQGERPIWGWTLVIGSSLAATAFNVIHAQNELISQVMHAIPSVFMLLAFETFLSQLKEGAQRGRVSKSLATLHTELTELQTHFEQQQRQLETELAQQREKLEGLVATKQTELERLEHQIEQERTRLQALKTERKNLERGQSDSIVRAKQIQLEQAASTMAERRTAIMQILQTEGDIGASAFAQRLDTSRGTVYNDLGALAEAGKIEKDESGWKVVKQSLSQLVVANGYTNGGAAS